MDDNTKKLEVLARKLRRRTIQMLYNIGSQYKGHPGPVLSIADIITGLYFEVLKIDPSQPNWAGRDRFILSKGHACPSLYVALAMRGFFEEKHLDTFRHVDSILQGHPDMKRTPVLI